MRVFVLLSVGLLFVLAASVYRAKLGAHESQADIAAVEADIQRLEDDIAVLRAEEAHLSRPDRIGPLARDHLGLEPLSPDQYVDADALAARVSPAPLEEAGE